MSVQRSIAALLILGVMVPATGQPPPVDRRLEQAVAWYTGTAGRMDDERAHQMLLEALTGGGALPQTGRRIGKAASAAAQVQLQQEDFFAVDWRAKLASLPDPLLLLGNLPWVTNAVQSTLSSENVPVKKNLHGLNGLDALMGKSFLRKRRK